MRLFGHLPPELLALQLGAIAILAVYIFWSTRPSRSAGALVLLVAVLQLVFALGLDSAYLESWALWKLRSEGMQASARVVSVTPVEGRRRSWQLTLEYVGADGNLHRVAQREPGYALSQLGQNPTSLAVRYLPEDYRVVRAAATVDAFRGDARLEHGLAAYTLLVFNGGGILLSMGRRRKRRAFQEERDRS